jgi:hypothetical protein
MELPEGAVVDPRSIAEFFLLTSEIPLDEGKPREVPRLGAGTVRSLCATANKHRNQSNQKDGESTASKKRLRMRRKSHYTFLR